MRLIIAALGYVFYTHAFYEPSMLESIINIVILVGICVYGLVLDMMEADK